MVQTLSPAGIEALHNAMGTYIAQTVNDSHLEVPPQMVLIPYGSNDPQQWEIMPASLIGSMFRDAASKELLAELIRSLVAVMERWNEVTREHTSMGVPA